MVTDPPEYSIGWLSFTKDEIMHTDGLETGYCNLLGGTAHFPLLYTMIGLTLPFNFFKEYRIKYKAIDNYGQRGCESLLFLILSPSQDSNDITSISYPKK